MNNYWNSQREYTKYYSRHAVDKQCVLVLTRDFQHGGSTTTSIPTKFWTSDLGVKKEIE